MFSYHERAEDLVAYPAFQKILPSAPYVQMAAEHRRSTSMAAITPPPLVVEMRRTPAALTDGDEPAFTMWLGPLPVEWPARIDAISDTGFTGRQLCGPFAEWIQRHTFTAVNDNLTDGVDEITLQLRLHPIWWLVGMGMWLSLPVLFAFRAWKTKRMLL